MKNLIFSLIALSLFSCGNGDNDPNPDAGGSDFGKVTSAVVIVNPVINEGSTTSVTPGTQRAGVSLQVENLAPITTDATGLAVIKDLPTGTVSIATANGNVDLNVVQSKGLYDLVLSYNANGTTEIIPAIRYPIGGTVTRVSPGQDLSAAFSTANAVVYLEPGEFTGTYEVTAEGVLIFGSWDPIEGSLSTIKGDLTIKGGNVRMRGVTVTETISVNANGFSAAFCEFRNANITGNSVALLRNSFSGTSVTVPSSSAILVDNDY